MKRPKHFTSNFGDTFVINRANQLSNYLNYSGTPNQTFLFLELNSSIANYSGWCAEYFGNLTKLPRLHRQSTILSDGFFYPLMVVKWYSPAALSDYETRTRPLDHVPVNIPQNSTTAPPSSPFTRAWNRPWLGYEVTNMLFSILHLIIFYYFILY